MFITFTTYAWRWNYESGYSTLRESTNFYITHKKTTGEKTKSVFDKIFVRNGFIVSRVICSLIVYFPNIRVNLSSSPWCFMFDQTRMRLWAPLLQQQQNVNKALFIHKIRLGLKWSIYKAKDIVFKTKKEKPERFRNFIIRVLYSVTVYFPNLQSKLILFTL